MLTIAADLSSSNRIVEQPHKMLKVQMRCMIYFPRLGIEFWVDAITHATWLNNRTYHGAIKMTPIQVYSGQITALDSLIIFGAKITVKLPRTGSTACNPWLYNGVFLEYQNTMYNIWYWDVYTGTIKTAKQHSKDETQYGDDIENRSPVSSHLMKVFTGSSDHTTNTEQETVKLKLNNVASPCVNDTLEDMLQYTIRMIIANIYSTQSVNVWIIINFYQDY